MEDIIIKILLALILMIACTVLANVLKTRKAYILAEVSRLVQKAEGTVQGSGMGTEKKRLVLAQLEAAGIKANAWLSNAIDEIVAALNERQAWFAEVAKDTLSESVTTNSGAKT